MMDAAFEFSINGLNMDFVLNLIADGHIIPDALFVDILTEKCQLIHKHIRTRKDCLLLVANINCTVATIKLFNRNVEDSQLLHCTITNHSDLEEHLWIDVHGIVRDYAEDDHESKLQSNDTYYSSLEYEEMMHACLL